jgi:hypothetical protein
MSWFITRSAYSIKIAPPPSAKQNKHYGDKEEQTFRITGFLDFVHRLVF